MVTNKPHIAIFLESLAGGGAERMMVTLANGFSEGNIEVDLVLVKAEGVYLSKLGSTVNLVDLKAGDTYRAFPKLVRYLNQRKPDTVLSTLTLADLILLLARSLAHHKPRVVLRIPTMISLHRRALLKKKIERALLALLYPWADQIFAVSKAVAEDISRYARITRTQIETIYNPVISPEITRLAGQDIDHPWFETGDPPVILGIGRFTPEKDFGTLLRAFAQLNSNTPARLVLLGEGRQRPYLEDLAIDLGVSERVEFPGFVENPFAYLKRAALFVLSSRYEGLPGALIQALACGCPVVSTDCPGGVREILGEGRYGHLVPVGDVDAMAETMQRVLAGEAKSVNEQWLAQFSQEHVLEEYLKVLVVD